MAVRVQQIEQCIHWVVGKPLAWALYLIGRAVQWGLVALIRTVARWTRPEVPPISQN